VPHKKLRIVWLGVKLTFLRALKCVNNNDWLCLCNFLIHYNNAFISSFIFPLDQCTLFLWVLVCATLWLNSLTHSLRHCTSKSHWFYSKAKLVPLPFHGILLFPNVLSFPVQNFPYQVCLYSKFSILVLLTWTWENWISLLNFINETNAFALLQTLL